MYLGQVGWIAFCFQAAHPKACQKYIFPGDCNIYYEAATYRLFLTRYPLIFILVSYNVEWYFCRNLKLHQCPHTIYLLFT